MMDSSHLIAPMCQRNSYSCVRRLLMGIVFFLLFPFLNSIYSQEMSDDMPHQEVEYWAQGIGTHTYELLNTVARYEEIKNNFKKQGASITNNDGLTLVKLMAADIHNMMKYKIQAVKRIMNVAEEVSQDASYLDEEWRGYYNSKLINDLTGKISSLEDRYQGRFKEYYGSVFKTQYNTLSLTSNRHFNNRDISLNASTVHVPTNVFEGGPNVRRAIRWSEALEKTFYANYKHDPTLSWQYFGSATGFLRQFPGSSWVDENQDPDLYDARLRPWYIQAANSPKDMVILLDVSGSMTGLRKEIAKHVVMNILDTLNENDFFNVLIFKENASCLVACLNETLVQANLENIGEYKSKLDDLDTENIANFNDALTKAFWLLRKYNSQHNDQGYGSQCNQAIMLITDGAPDTYEQIFKENNWPQKQIRLFTYLIGREVTETNSLVWMACANKGYFVHVTTPSEVREQVLKYIPVVARPMVMYQNKHPTVWTGVYADVANRRSDPDSPHGYTLMTTVSVPVFNQSTRVKVVADLLGVAGTDVPIKEIKKLAPPYKLGVNGYAFMVNKNGHILFHPDLRPTFLDILKPNYNSVDLTEVELPHALDEPRMNHSDLETLRRDMIEQRGAETNFRVRIHLDDMKRVVIREQRYYTEKISDTPFSLGIAMPQGYGKFQVSGQIELSLEMKNNMHFNASNFFQHGKWSLHPDWVYCEYKYDKDDKREKRTPEELLLHFLIKAQMPGWKWRSTRTKPPPSSNQAPKGSTQDDENEYYCDKTLLQSLLFDAKATDVYNEANGRKIYEAKNEGEYEKFGIVNAFVATRSGLSRWIDLRNSSARDFKPQFMDRHKKAIDEVWYRRAVDYYNEDPEAYVYSVPFDAATQNQSEVMVTATRAIYVNRNEYHYAPAAVVGVNIRLDTFATFFMNKTYNCRELYRQKTDCKREKTCQSKDLDCYLLDDNGFVVASEDARNTGKFFGSIEGTIMDSLIQSEVYNKIKIFDYQAVCLDTVPGENYASILLTPVETLKWLFKWIIGNIMWLLIKTEIYHLWDPNQAWAYSHEIEEPPIYTEYQNRMLESPTEHSGSNDNLLVQYVLLNSSVEDSDNDYNGYDEEVEIDENFEGFYDYDQPKEAIKLEMAFINKTRPRPCDKYLFLYKVNSSKLKEGGLFKPVKGKLSNCHENGCGKPFSIQKVVNTNLILIVVHNVCPCEAKNVDIIPKEVPIKNDTLCLRMQTRSFRERPAECYFYHPDEVSITECGRCSQMDLPSLRTLLCIVFAYMFCLSNLKT